MGIVITKNYFHKNLSTTRTKSQNTVKHICDNENVF